MVGLQTFDQPVGGPRDILRPGQMGRYLASTGALLAALAASPAVAAAAPTVTAGQACYINSNPLAPSPVTVSGAGWTPGDTVDLAGRGLSGSTTVAADGTFVQSIPGVNLGTSRPDARGVAVTATDAGDSTTGTPATGVSAETSFMVANLSVATSPAETAPGKPVTFSFSGFIPGSEIYGHYLHRGRVMAISSFGRAGGACGVLKHKARLYPGGHPRYRSYAVQFDDAKRYSTKAQPRIDTTLSITGY